MNSSSPVNISRERNWAPAGRSTGWSITSSTPSPEAQSLREGAGGDAAELVSYTVHDAAGASTSGQFDIFINGVLIWLLEIYFYSYKTKLVVTFQHQPEHTERQQHQIQPLQQQQQPYQEASASGGQQQQTRQSSSSSLLPSGVLPKPVPSPSPASDAPAAPTRLIRYASGKTIDPLTKQPMQLIHELVPDIDFRVDSFGTR